MKDAEGNTISIATPGLHFVADQRVLGKKRNAAELQFEHPVEVPVNDRWRPRQPDQQLPKNECPACSYQNKEGLLFCEICAAMLRNDHLAPDQRREQLLRAINAGDQMETLEWRTSKLRGSKSRTRDLIDFAEKRLKKAKALGFDSILEACNSTGTKSTEGQALRAMLAEHHSGVRFDTDDKIRELDEMAKPEQRDPKPMSREERSKYAGIDYLVNKDKTGGHITRSANRQEEFPVALASKRAAWELAWDEADDDPTNPTPKHKPYSTNWKPGRRMKGYSQTVVPQPKYAKGKGKGNDERDEEEQDAPQPSAASSASLPHESQEEPVPWSGWDRGSHHGKGQLPDDKEDDSGGSWWSQPKWDQWHGWKDWS